VGVLAANGDAQIAVQQVAELLAVPGVDVVGPMPEELQEPIPTSAGIPSRAKNAEAARALLTFLRSGPGQAVLREQGMFLP
jgi:molybdate transport system substrate-binding protein